MNPSKTIQTSSRDRVFAFCSQTRHLPLQRGNTSTQAFIDPPQTPFDAIAESTLALRISINRHSTWNGSMAEIWHFRHVRLLLVAVNLPSRNVGLQTLAEVHGTHDCVCDGHHNQNNDSERGQRFPDWNKLLLMRGLIHAEKLEDEVSQGEDV